jgi:methyltransferase (TIGR00027 family)
VSQKAAATGPDAMFFVAVEQGFPQGERILSDELALPILPLGSRIWVRLLRPVKRWLVGKTEAKVPGLWGGITARKRYIDDALSEHPATAVVNLGAGFDTRGCRLGERRVWELDQRSTIEAKRKRLRKIFGKVPDNLTLVPVDFDRDDLGTALASHGHEARTPTFFIWEGVTQYLTEDGFRATFKFLKGAAPGSRLVFTYVPADYIEGEKLYGQEFLYQRMRMKDNIWHFGIDPAAIDGLLAGYGWQVVEHLGYDELDTRYVKPTGRDLGWIAIERIVHARKPTGE